MNKYLKTKEGSIEDLAKQMQNKVLESDYQDKFKKELDKAGKPIGQMTGAEKKAFFNKIDKMHSAKNEQAKNPYAIGMAAAMKAKDDKPPLKKSTITKAHDIAKSIEKDQKESVEINEADITLHDHDSTDKDFKDLVRKSNLTMKVKKGYKGDDVTLSGNSSNIENMLKTMYGSDWNKTYKKSGNRYIEAEYKKEDYTKKDVDKFHTSLDKLVHKSFGHSSDEKKKEMKEEEKDVPKGYHKMPDGKIMKDSEHKKEEVKETHSFVTNKQNQKQKEVGGEKEPIKTPKNEWKTFAMMAAELREKKEEKEDKKEMQAGDDTRDKSKKTMTGQVATSPEMNPKVDYKY